MKSTNTAILLPVSVVWDKESNRVGGILVGISASILLQYWQAKVYPNRLIDDAWLFSFLILSFIILSIRIISTTTNFSPHG